MSWSLSQAGITRGQAHVTVSTVTSLSNLTGPVYEHWKIPPSLWPDFVTSVPPSFPKALIKSLPVFNPFWRCA